MTVNERLFAARLFADYEAAVAAKDVARMEAVLAQVGLVRDGDGMHWSKHDAGPTGSVG
jgi:hypothetical protein